MTDPQIFKGQLQITGENPNYIFCESNGNTIKLYKTHENYDPIQYEMLTYLRSQKPSYFTATFVRSHPHEEFELLHVHSVEGSSEPLPE